MSSSSVNAPAPAPHRAPSHAGKSSARGEGFDALVSEQAEDADDTKPQAEQSTPDAVSAGLVGLPFALQGAGAAGETPTGSGSKLASVGQKPEGGVTAGASKMTNLATALQLQAQGLAAGPGAVGQAGATAQALAAAGIVSLKGESESVDVKIGGASGAQAPSGPAASLAAGAEAGKAGKNEGGKGAEKTDAAKAAAQVAAFSAFEKEQPETETKAAPKLDAGGSEATRQSQQPDRIQTLQTSAAPATPSAPGAASGQVSGAQAAAVQVANQIAEHAGSRRTRFEVRLDPSELGRVDVRLDIGHDGRVSTRLIVERVETLDMLRNDARELSRTLEQAGFQLGQGGLAFQLKDGRQQQWAFDEAIHGGSSATEEIEDVAPVAAAYARGAAPGVSGVDRTV